MYYNYDTDPGHPQWGRESRSLNSGYSACRQRGTEGMSAASTPGKSEQRLQDLVGAARPPEPTRAEASKVAPHPPGTPRAPALLPPPRPAEARPRAQAQGEGGGAEGPPRGRSSHGIPVCKQKGREDGRVVAPGLGACPTLLPASFEGKIFLPDARIEPLCHKRQEDVPHRSVRVRT